MRVEVIPLSTVGYDPSWSRPGRSVVTFTVADAVAGTHVITRRQWKNIPVYDKGYIFELLSGDVNQPNVPTAVPQFGKPSVQARFARGRQCARGHTP